VQTYCCNDSVGDMMFAVGLTRGVSSTAAWATWQINASVSFSIASCYHCHFSLVSHSTYLCSFTV